MNIFFNSAILFSLWGALLLSSPITVSSFLFYILGIGSLSFLIPILFLLLHLFFHTLYIIPLSFLPSLLFPLSSSMLLGTSYTTCFSLVFQEGILVFSFYRFGPPCFHIPYSPHTLLLPLLSTILFQAEVHVLKAYSLPHNILVPFPI